MFRTSIRRIPKCSTGIAVKVERGSFAAQLRLSAPRIRQCLRNSSTRASTSPAMAGHIQTNPPLADRRYQTTTAQPVPEPFDDSIFLSQFDDADSNEPPSFELAAHDPTSVLILDAHKGLQATDSPTAVTLATFEACVRVERLARAQTLLLQLSQELPNDSPTLLNAHNLFLEGLIKRMKVQPNSDISLVFRWFDEKVTKKYEIKTNSTTYAHLLSAALHIKEPSIAKKTVKFYMEQWVGNGGTEAQIFENRLLSDEESAQIQEILSKKTGRSKKALPEVLSTTTSGSSLDILNKHLEVLTNPASTTDDYVDAYKKQELLEESSVRAALEEWKAESEALEKAGVPKISRPVGVLLWQWQQEFAQMIEEEILAIKRVENGNFKDAERDLDRSQYGPFLMLLPPEKMAATVLLELIKLQRSNGITEGMRAAAAIATIGDALQMEYQSTVLLKRREKMPRGFTAGLFSSPRTLRRLIKQAREKNEIEAFGVEGSIHDWPNDIKMKIGGLLLSMVIKVARMPIANPSQADPGATVTEEHPVFYHTFLYLRGRRVGIIKSHPEFAKYFTLPQFNKDNAMHRRYLPMVAPPRPWLSFNDGGYLATATNVMRTGSSSEQRQYLEAATERGDLDTLFRALDVLGKTAWTVNHNVFDVFVQIWNTGEALADIPPAKKDEPLPPPPDRDADPQARARWGRDMKILFTKRANEHSQRCDLNLKLVVARAFLNETFYFPHNVDFRGRAYPIPPHFNHMGNDLCRGLLLFGKGKELGESGLRWLQIHLSNVFGYDKASFSERAQFAIDHMEDILDSANNPLDGKRWWLEGENPWQTLACCFALRDAYALEDPTKYICYQHVAMDGSCNGLQHYAALGGDEWGARHVNLEPSDRPQDIYTGVCDIVNEMIDKEAAAGDEQAKLLQGHVVRKTVKQTVMTYVYGVTFMGAKAQIEARLKDDKAFAGLAVPERHSLAINLTRKTLGAVQKMFHGAAELQRWLVECAYRISRSAPAPRPGSEPADGRYKEKQQLMNTVVWTTPLGLPVVQPYRKVKMKTIVTNVQKLHLNDPTVVEQVIPRKQASAFPPNFIHSLDATHMHLSALKCHEVGLDFAAVHDSFWTHPSDVDTMNRILRDAFVSVHCRDITNEVREEFKIRYANHFTQYTLSNPAAARAISKFRGETYGKVKMTEEYELHLENSRMMLLASEDPEVRKQGEQMVTPFSILLKYEPDFMQKYESRLGTDEEIVPASEEEVGSPEEIIEEGGEDEPIIRKGSNKLEATEEQEVVEDTIKEDTLAEDATESIDELLEGLEKDDIPLIAGEGAVPVKPRHRDSQAKVTRVWVPLRFPEVPLKGSFNINNLKDSLYFFS